MQVFNLCMKILRKNKVSILLYVFIFLGIAIMISAASASHPIAAGYSTEKTDLAFYSEEDTPFISGLKEELGKKANFVNVPDSGDALRDALYFRKVNYIVHIPKGFTEKFMRGEKVQITKTAVPDSSDSVYLGTTIDRYLNTAALYVKSGTAITQEQLVASLKADFAKTAETTLFTSDTTDSKSMAKPFTAHYFNYFGYVFPAVLIFGISVLMEVFNDKDLRWRTFCSPMLPKTYNTQFLLAVTVFAVAYWFVLLLPCIALDAKHFFTRNTAYQALNSFVFLTACTGLSFLIGNLIHSKQALSAATNVFALGPSFISGVFVPQTMLNDHVLKIASFTPTYWYVTANEKLSFMQNFTQANLASVWRGMAMQLAFAAAFFALGLLAGKRRRLEN